MTRQTGDEQRGFTLVEAIIAIVITGIVAGIVAVFMVLPIQGYLDSTRRAAMTDVADTALRRIAYELRAAVPNSVRIASSAGPGLTSCSAAPATNCYLEFVPASDGGRYRAQRDALGCAVASPADPIDNSDDCSAADNDRFDVLGPTVAGGIGDFVVVFNTGQAGLDAYAGDNRRSLNAVAGAKVGFTATASLFPPYESPSQRFQIVPASGPVTFSCSGVGTSGSNGTGELRRHTAYGFPDPQDPTTLSAGALLADRVSGCRVDYAAVSATNGLLVLQLTITRDSESITLHHEIHVDNTP